MEAATISKYIHCMDIKGSEPSNGGWNGWGWGGGNDDDSKASCPSSGNYIMTSCSARVNGSARMMGGVIDIGNPNECVAYTDEDESYNQAIARCCNLTGLIFVITAHSIISINGPLQNRLWIII